MTDPDDDLQQLEQDKSELRQRFKSVTTALGSPPSSDVGDRLAYREYEHRQQFETIYLQFVHLLSSEPSTTDGRFAQILDPLSSYIETFSIIHEELLRV